MYSINPGGANKLGWRVFLTNSWLSPSLKIRGSGFKLPLARVSLFYSCEHTFASSSLVFPIILSLINLICSFSDILFHFGGRGLVVSIMN